MHPPDARLVVADLQHAAQIRSFVRAGLHDPRRRHAGGRSASCCLCPAARPIVIADHRAPGQGHDSAATGAERLISGCGLAEGSGGRGEKAEAQGSDGDGTCRTGHCDAHLRIVDERRRAE